MCVSMVKSSLFVRLQKQSSILPDVDVVAAAVVTAEVVATVTIAHVVAAVATNC